MGLLEKLRVRLGKDRMQGFEQIRETISSVRRLHLGQLGEVGNSGEIGNDTVVVDRDGFCSAG
jgi:hypothetical protein